MKLRICKYWLIIAGLIVLSVKASAQDGIDTALFKQLGVKKMWAYIKLPILQSKTLNDSCLVEVYDFDTLERIIHQKKDMNCYGWSGSTENYNTYDALNRLIYSRVIAEEGETGIRYAYNNKNDVVKIVQKKQQHPDSFVTFNFYNYTKKGKPDTVKILNIIGTDTSWYIINYEYDTALNVKTVWTYTEDKKLIQKQTYDITPVSRKLLEFSTETVLPDRSFTRGWNYYNFDAQLSRTQYSNNTWTEFVYKENGLLDQSLSYNMQGKLNAWKMYYYEFHEPQ